MIRKSITMDYEEYEDLLKQIEVLKSFIKDYYELANANKRLEIQHFMQKYGNWC